MKMRDLFKSLAIWCILALILTLKLGTCGEGKQENAKAEAEAKAEAKAKAKAEAEARKNLIFSEDGKTITGVKDKGIKSVVIPDGVTSIGDGAFNWCSSLTSVTIPDSVTSIGDYAFRLCRSLTSVTIPDSVTSIGDRAFTGVQSVQVSAGNPVFSVDESGVLINKKVKKLLYVPRSLSGSYTIPDSVTRIGKEAFDLCTALTSVTIGNGVTSIGDYAFRRCEALTSVTIPDSVTSIGKNVFWDCSKLTSVTIGNGVTSIGRSAFSDCEALTSVTIGNGVTSIGSGAFSGCEALTSVTIPDSVTSIESGAFTGVQSVQVSAGNPVFSVDESGVLINKKEKKLLYVPRSLSGSYTIPDSVTSIGDYAFSGCKSLTSVTIPAKFTDKDVNRWFYGDLFIPNKIGKSPNCKIIRK